MDHEVLVVDTIVSIYDLYDDYSDLQYDEVRAEINHRLLTIQTNLRQLLAIPAHDTTVQRGFTLKSSALDTPVQFTCVGLKSGNYTTIAESVRSASSADSLSKRFKTIRSLSTQVKRQSNGNPFVQKICQSLSGFASVAESELTRYEEQLIKVVSRFFIFEFIFRSKSNHRQLHRDVEEFASSAFPEVSFAQHLDITCDDAVFTACYDHILLYELDSHLPSNTSLEALQLSSRALAVRTVSAYKNFNSICYFYHLQASIKVNKAAVELNKALSDDTSKEIVDFIKQFYRRHPFLPELCDMKQEYEESFGPGQNQDTDPDSQVPTISSATIASVKSLLYTITAAFKTYELYEAKPGASKIDENYYEFKFPEIFSKYCDLLVDTVGSENLLRDPYFRAVCTEVLKYRDSEITAECWDVALHSLCQIMFGRSGKYQNLKSTLFHRASVFEYAKSQSYKRFHFGAWREATLRNKEFDSLRMLYDKAQKGRVLSLWIRNFVRARSLSVQAEKYKSAYNRNVMFSRWLNYHHDIIYLNNIADNFSLSKYLGLWLTKSSKENLSECLESFTLYKKARYFAKVVNKFNGLSSMETKANSLVITKFVKRFNNRSGHLESRRVYLDTFTKQKFMGQWKNALKRTEIMAQVRANNQRHLTSWFLSIWLRRTREQHLCRQFLTIRNEETLKDYFFNILLVKENNDIASEFRRRKLLMKQMRTFRLNLLQKRFKESKDKTLRRMYYEKLKSTALAHLFRDSSDYKKIVLTFKGWREQASEIRDGRNAKHEETFRKVSAKFAKAQKMAYLKVFLYKWEDSTIVSLEKKEMLDQLAETHLKQQLLAPCLSKWRKSASRVATLKERAALFDRNVTTAAFLGLMLDKYDEVIYLNQVAEESMEVLDARLATQMLKRWSLKLLRLRSTNNLVHDFNRRSEVVVLRSFFNMWKESVDSKPDLDESFSNYAPYSPLLHRYPKRMSSQLALEGKASTSTPLIHFRDGSLHSPRRRVTDDASSFKSRSPRSFRTPGRSSLGSLSLNSDSYKRSEAAKLRSRFQGLKLSPSTNVSFNTSITRFEEVASPPPPRPTFEASRRSSDHLEDDLFRSSSSPIDEIAEPHVNSAASLIEKLRGYPLSLYEHTRSSSLTAVDQSSSQESESHNDARH